MFNDDFLTYLLFYLVLQVASSLFARVLRNVCCHHDKMEVNAFHVCCPKHKKNEALHSNAYLQRNVLIFLDNPLMLLSTT